MYFMIPVWGFRPTWTSSVPVVTGRVSVPASMLLGSPLLLLDPACEFVRRHHVHGDEHLRVEDAAQLGALSLVGARLIHLEPGVVHAAGVRVHLDTEVGQEPGV